MLNKQLGVSPSASRYQDVGFLVFFLIVFFCDRAFCSRHLTVERETKAMGGDATEGRFAIDFGCGSVVRRSRSGNNVSESERKLFCQMTRVLKVLLGRRRFE